MLKKVLSLCLAAALFVSYASAQLISFDQTMTHNVYISCEPVEVTVNIVNKGARPIVISDFETFKNNRLYFEISKATAPHFTLRQVKPGKIVPELNLEKGEGIEFSVELSEWYDLTEEGKYFVKAVLVSGDTKYSTELATFEIVPGIELLQASQYVAGHPAIERTLSFVYWTRDGKDVAFLKAWDKSTGARYQTLTIGTILRVKKPVLEPIDDTSYYFYRQVTRDVFVRAEVHSTVDGISVKEQLQAIDQPSSPMVDSLRKAVEDAAAKKKPLKKEKPVKKEVSASNGGKDK